MKINLVMLLGFLLSGCVDQGAITSATVSITNLSNTSGGSGTIMSHSKHLSTVLTNSHVCRILETGGLVHSDNDTAYFVTGYQVSTEHDLCLVHINSDLGISSKLSLSAPIKYDLAIVSGHPHLLPTIITTGHFSSKKIIDVVTGYKKCTSDDLLNPAYGFICLITGTIPLIKTYESIVVSPTIQAGSSGSGIYGQDNAIKAVVFAGAGDFGYGFAVPYEYIHHFLNSEVPLLTIQTPSLLYTPASAKQEQLLSDKIEETCETAESNEQKAFCRSFEQTLQVSDLIYRE